MTLQGFFNSLLKSETATWDAEKFLNYNTVNFFFTPSPSATSQILLFEPQFFALNALTFVYLE